MPESVRLRDDAPEAPETSWRDAGGPSAGRVTAVAALVPVLLAAWVCRRITGAYFMADDFTCLLSIANDGFVRFVLRPFGGHNLLVRNLVFYVSYQLFGLHPGPYFWSVLVVHLVNVWLLVRVLHRLGGSLVLACLGATLWGTSPAVLGTLSWYAVFGQVLVVTILLVVLDAVTRRARGERPPSGREAAAWYVLLLLGTTCFGTGIGVALAFPAVLFLVWPAAWRHRGIRVAHVLLPLVTVALYLAYRRLYGLIEPLSFYEAIAGVLTARRVWDALPMLRELLGVGLDAALESFFFAPTRYPSAATAIIRLLFGAGVLVVWWRGDATARRATLAMLALCVGVYFVIALGRQPFDEKEATRLWLAGVWRYHYVGTIPIIVVTCLVLATLGRFAWTHAVPRAALVLAVGTAGVIGYLRSDVTVDDHSAARAAFARLLGGIALEASRATRGTTVYLENGDPPAALLGPVMVHVKEVFPARAAVFVLGFPTDELDGRRVRFIERDPAVRAWHARWPDSRLARLLVAPEAVPQPGQPGGRS